MKAIINERYDAKEGERVLIRPDMIYATSEERSRGYDTIGIPNEMIELAGREALIVWKQDNGYRIDLDNGQWYWSGECFMPLIKYEPIDNKAFEDLFE